MVVLPIVLALAAIQCDVSLQPVTAALQQNDLAKASSLLAAVLPECSQSSSFYALTGVTDELSGRTAEAEVAFRKAIELDPKSARFREQLGAVYLRNHEAKKAADTLSEAVALDPSNPVAKKFLIGAYVETGAWPKAATLFNEIGGKSAASSDPLVLLWYARTLIETSQFDRLERDLPPGTTGLSSPFLFSVGTLLAQKAMYRSAIRYLERIPENDADEAVYFNEGLAYSHLQQFDKARVCYFRAIDKHPQHVDAYFRTGIDYSTAGDQRKALPWLLRAHQWAHERADISYALIEQLIELNYLDTADQILSQSKQASKDDLLLTTAEGDLRQTKDDARGAEAAYRSVLSRQASFVPALVGLARLKASTSNNEEARSLLVRALAQNAGDPGANSELGTLESRQQNWVAAQKHLREAWSRNKSRVTVAVELARAERHLNDPDAALKTLSAIPAVTQQTSAYHLELAEIYTQLHRPGDAQAQRKAVSDLQAAAHAELHFEEPKVYVY
jgi:tetratricopeptide (TPR) repeat protein